MPLSSVGQTALTGIQAATALIDAVGNNMANAQTNGFKQSFPELAAQGSKGVGVFGMQTDFSQGTLALSNNSSDLALEGNGFFMVEGPEGEHSYTRDGRFRVNASQELVTSEGYRVLGYGVDENHQIDKSRLQALKIPAFKAVKAKDGSATHLRRVSVDADGTLRGHFSDGLTRDLGQLQIAHFANPRGLVKQKGSRYSSGVNSGLPVVGQPGEGGGATVVGGASELSNTDIGQNLIQLTLATNMFRANAAVFKTSDDLLSELNYLRR